MREILEQSPMSVAPMQLPEETGEELQSWIDFVSGRIRDARKNAGLTQTQLAEKSGLPQSHISRLESGRHSPSSLTLEKIARALDIPMSTFDPSA